MLIKVLQPSMPQFSAVYGGSWEENSFMDPTTNTVAIVDKEYRKQCAVNFVGSKGMIQRNDSSRKLMARLNNDESVEKAWPVYTLGIDSKPSRSHLWDHIGYVVAVWMASPYLRSFYLERNRIPMYGPLQIGYAEPINLHFGHFGISGLPSDTGATSHASSVDESRGELTSNGSRCDLSCWSPPRFSEGHAKELKKKILWLIVMKKLMNQRRCTILVMMDPNDLRMSWKAQ